MKYLFFLSTVIIHLSIAAQKTETYYDYNWKSCVPEMARYFSILEKTDSGWFRKDFYISSETLQMQALYEDKACTIQNGYGRYYYANGRASSIGRMLKNKQEGICVSYHSNGMISDSALFHNGRIVDKRFRWHRNGYMADSITRVNDSMSAQVGWFDDGALAYAGFIKNLNKQGKWKFYHHNGQLAGIEVYDNDRMLSGEYFNENGSPRSDTAGVNREADFKGGNKGWQKYLNKNLYWPPGLQFTVSGSITVELEFTINEEGKVEEAEVYLPFHPEFDRIALDAVRLSPVWIPAISHNRKIKVRRRQPVTFQQEE